MDQPLMLWGGFFTMVLAMLALDLGVFHRKSHTIKLKEAAIWSFVWIGVGLAFNGFVYYQFGIDKALEFFTSYVVEKSLSVDNLFVILALFAFFGVKGEYQHKVLFWGIIGAVVTRTVFIFAGVALIEHLAWVMYIFGAFLIWKGYALWKATEEEDKDFSQMWLIRQFKRFFPVTDKDHGDRLLVRETDPRTGKSVLMATGLFVVLLAVEFVDIIFAIDSIPAIIGITQDKFILVTSNIMAILGLRSLFFVLAAVNYMFRYLQKGMCLVLVFVGFKMVAHHFFHVPTLWSLGIIGALIGGSILLSVLIPDKSKGS